MEAIIVMAIFQLIWFSPCFLLMEHPVELTQSLDEVPETPEGKIPYYADGKFVKFMEA